MATFTVEQIQLTSVNPETGVNNTASVYCVDGIDRQLSISELALVICMKHATAYEAEVVQLMADMNATTYQLEQLAKLEDKLSEKRSAMSSDSTTVSLKFTEIGLSLDDFPSTDSWTQTDNWLDWLKNAAKVSTSVTASGSCTGTQLDTIISDMETKMDELNSFSQKTMIELQSKTNKRDQAYDLGAAIVKSLSTVLTGNANNL